MSRPEILPLVFERVGYAARGQHLLHDVSFSLGAGPVSVILGPNGAGKTLLLRLANGLLRPSAGSVRWDGADAAGVARHIALVFQRPVLLRRSARANVEFALRLHGVAADERARRTGRVLEAVRLAPLAERPARLLSVGQQHRLALARAWALEPEVLFLDEPAASLDPGASRALESAIRAIRAEGTKIVLTTHDLAQAERMADEVLFLHRGRLVESGPAASFFAEPRSAEARKFLQGEILD
ncbi:MAG: ATP-binding cassette domain-containing protein [Myxococcota bacterium]|nr:ATP-binding cassette domain-containing protein [Myxococcota bacterium]